MSSNDRGMSRRSFVKSATLGAATLGAATESEPLWASADGYYPAPGVTIGGCFGCGHHHHHHWH